MLKLLAIIMVLVALPVQAQNVSNILNQQVAFMRTKMGSGTFAQIALATHKNEARHFSFNIQAITRLFEKEDKAFKELKKDIKVFEDHLGEIGKWDSLLERPEFTGQQRETFKRNFELALANFAKYLEKASFESLLNKHMKKIAEVDISEKKTKKILIQKMHDEIDELMTKKYDFTYGETGLHELRRNLRWPLMELETFTQHFTTKKVSCAVSEWYEKGLKSDYIQVRENSKASFTLDYCAYVELSGAVEVLGKIKNKLERAGILDDRVSPEIAQQTSDLLNQVRAKLLRQLILP